MADEITLSDEKFISSKRASQLSGYAQDYIGQLARKGLIEAKRIGGHWYVSLESVEKYTAASASYKPEPPQRGVEQTDVDTVLSFDGRSYISAARAAKATGYHQDYVGQLARSGKVPSRQVGNRWYVEREAIEAHKEEKDSLLGAVQAEAVGIPRAEGVSVAPASDEPFFSYVSEAGKDLLPVAREGEYDGRESVATPFPPAFPAPSYEQNTTIPIRVIRRSTAPLESPRRAYSEYAPSPQKETAVGKFAITAALTFVIVLSLGYISLRENALYAVQRSGFGRGVSELAASGSVAGILQHIADWAEKLLGHDITYIKK